MSVTVGTYNEFLKEDYIIQMMETRGFKASHIVEWSGGTIDILRTIEPQRIALFGDLTVNIEHLQYLMAHIYPPTTNSYCLAMLNGYVQYVLKHNGAGIFQNNVTIKGILFDDIFKYSGVPSNTWWQAQHLNAVETPGNINSLRADNAGSHWVQAPFYFSGYKMQYQ